VPRSQRTWRPTSGQTRAKPRTGQVTAKSLRRAVAAYSDGHAAASISRAWAVVAKHVWRCQFRFPRDRRWFGQ
jgi:hypothetical protein